MSKRSKKAQVWIGHQAEGHEPEVLLFRVIDVRGGGWHPVTGGVEKGETFFEGAKREVLEETGIPEKSGKWIDLEYIHEFTGRFGDVEEHVFGFILKSAKQEPVLDPREHLEFKWVPLKDALTQVRFEPQRHALKKFSCYFK